MIWGFIVALLPLGFGLQGYLDPGAHFPEALTQGDAIYGGAIGLYIARNMASVVITLFALAKRSAHMLIIVLLLRAVTDLFDVINNSISGTVNAELIIFATLWVSGSSIAIYQLWHLPTVNHQQP